jgi:arylsulfatase A-like enzyme/Flp pilus assembly protein TadD
MGTDPVEFVQDKKLRTGGKTRRLVLIVGAVLLVGLFVGYLVTRKSHRPPNLVLIGIDTLRADRLGCYGYENIQTPHMDDLARRGVLFENTTAHIPVTLPSLSSILTSTLPPTHGVHYNEGFYLSSSAMTLAEILREEGYETGAVVGAVVLDSITGVSQGFSRYDDDFETYTSYAPQIEILETQLSHTQRRAQNVTDLALPLSVSMAEKGPFFLFLHYFDPHTPYDPPPPHSNIDPSLVEGSEEIFKARYDREIAYTDEQIGRLLKGLEERGLMENTLVVLTSDHGEALGEHGELSHGYYVYEETMHVPMIFTFPGKVPQGVRYAGLSRHIDILPTILDILGLDGVREGKFQGESLLPFDSSSGPEISYIECAMTFIVFDWSALRGVRSVDWKYIAAPREELYDLSADREEESNVIDQMPHVADSLRKVLEEIVSGIDVYQGGEAGQEMSAGKGGRPGNPQFGEQLGALGYIGAPKEILSGYEEMFDPSLPNPKEKREEFDRIMSANLNLRHGMAFVLMDSLHKAIESLDKAVEQNPGNAEPQFYLGLAHGELGNHDEAERRFEAAIERDPSHIRAALALVDLHRVKGDSARAVAELEGIFSRDPENPLELILGGRLWGKLGSKGRAIDAMKRAIEIDPDNVPARLYLGENALLEEEYPVAFTWLEPLEIRVDDRDSLAARVHYGLGRCYYIRGDLEKAKKAFLKVTSLDPTASAGHNQLGLIYDDLGEYERAVSHYLQALELEPALVEVHSNLGVTYFRMGKYRRAREEFEAYLPYAVDDEEGIRLRNFIEQIHRAEASEG